MARFRPELAVLLSFVLTAVVITNAFYNRKQFYPSVVYLTKSNASMAILYFQAFVIALLAGKLMNKVFFGQLRAIELEHLFERSWYAITETCLAFTVFRDDFSPKFVTMFTILLFLKCFHWLAEDRIDYMERSPIITPLFHMRMLSLMALLMAFDLNFVLIAYNHTMVKGASVQLVFGFEYAILFISILSTFLRYILHTIDIQNENPWENKGIYVLYGDLALGFVRVLLYLAFMSLMIKIHTFPLFAIRPMYLSLRSFKKSLNDVIMSRRAIRNLNIMYPDVTAEQLRGYTDTICIICREEMLPANNVNDNNPSQIKRLPCDHIFHKSCLRSWFQRQQTCPTCRTSILRLNNNQTNAAQAPQQQQPRQQAQPQAANVQQQSQNTQATPAAASSNTTQPTSTSNNSQPNLIFNPFIGCSRAQQANSNPILNTDHFFNQSFGILPPFAFMPPPMPPLNIAPSLSIDELAEMEGNERHNVEARIHCLRNISVLLNASMVQMQQYMNVCAATSHLDNLNKTKDKNASVKIENDLNYINKNETGNLPTNSKSGGTVEIGDNLSDNVFTKLKQEFDKAEETSKEPNDSVDNGKDAAESTEIRQRRLQRFLTNQEQ